MFTQRLQGMGDASLMAMKQLSQIVHRQAVGWDMATPFHAELFYRPQLLVMLLKKPGRTCFGTRALEHDPESGYGFPKRSCSNKKIERDDDSKKSHRALRPESTISSACQLAQNPRCIL